MNLISENGDWKIFFDKNAERFLLHRDNSLYGTYETYGNCEAAIHRAEQIKKKKIAPISALAQNQYGPHGKYFDAQITSEHTTDGYYWVSVNGKRYTTYASAILKNTEGNKETLRLIEVTEATLRDLRNSLQFFSREELLKYFNPSGDEE